MEETTSAVDQITSLFDIGPLVTFLVAAGGVILGFAMAKKALGFARSMLKRA
ncbi:hypothetical protein HYO11_18725 [Vibrio parahaemolyticus]|nr:hypothetical protein [Vibrio parahaemolyticus]